MSEKKIVVIDSQILNTVQECSRKADYSFNKSLEPIVKPDYFEKGDLLHQMLAQYYKLRKHRNSWSTNHKTHADIVEICIKVGRLAAIKMSLDIDTVEEVIDTFTQYCTHRVNDGWDQILFVEEVAAKILYESDNLIILYQGKLDLGISIQNCPILPVDHKSSSRRGKPSYHSNQFKGYCWLLGVNNIFINKIGFQRTLKPEEKFERHLMSYDPEVLEEWRQNSIYWILKYLRESEEGHFPPNYTSCDKYSGCVFSNVCMRTAESREYKLIQLFKEREEKWDPGKK